MTRGAFDYQGDDCSRKDLLPEDRLGQLFLHWFKHCWRFILALTPEGGERPEWRTETRYPLEPRDLWDLYRDPEVLLGLCFGKYTRYLMGDIDRKSKNHPDNNKERFEGILRAMEGIGLCRPIVVRSSESGGLHIYWFLPEEVHSWTLAFAAKRALNKAGEHFKLIDGQLELFPNPKVFDPSRITNFKPHRLPLQAGSCLLDWNLQPICKSVGTLLDWANWSAEGQDMGALRAAMVKAEEQAKKEQYFWKRRQSGEQFAADLQKIMNTGWTGYGQTNFLLWKFAAYGIIFERLQNEELFNWILKTVKNTSGYKRFCRHQHEIEKRIREWVKCASKYYYPYPNHPPRDKTFKEVVGKEKNKIVAFARSKQVRRETIERVKYVVSILKKEGDYPQKVKAREDAIIAKSFEVYKKGFSGSTLYLKEYKYLWHPEYEGGNVVEVDFKGGKYPRLPDPWDLEDWDWEYKYLWESESEEGKEENREGVNRDSVVGKYPSLGDPWGSLDRGVKSSDSKGFVGLQVRNTNEGCFGLLLPASGENLGTTTERSEGEEALSCTGEGVVAEKGKTCNQSLETILFCSVFLEIITLEGEEANSSSANQSFNFHSSSEINSNQLSSTNRSLFDRADSNVLNFLMELLNSDLSELFIKNNLSQEGNENSVLELINSLKGSSDKSCLYLGSSEARSKNDQFLDKSNLLILKMLLKSTGSRDRKSEFKVLKPSVLPRKPSKGSKSTDEGFTSTELKPAPSSLNLSQFLSRWQQEESKAVSRENNSDVDEMSEEEQTSLLCRQAIRLKLKALRESKHLVQVFCKAQGVRLSAKVRELLEQLLKHNLFRLCPSPLLRAEAREWFNLHREEIDQASSLGSLEVEAFWNYFADLLF